MACATTSAVLRLKCLCFCLLLIAVTARVVSAAESSAKAVSFKSDLAPLLQKKCVSCHGPEKAKGHYRLHTFGELLKPGDSKSSPVVAGRPEASELYRRLVAKDDDDRMPQKDEALPAAQIALFERWIREGARFDGMDTNAALAAILPKAARPEPPVAYPRAVPVRTLAFNADGSEIAAGGYHEVTIWNPTNGALLRRIPGLAQNIHGLAYSPDGAQLAVAGGAPGVMGEVALVDPARGVVKRTLMESLDVVLSVCFSPDGRRLAAGGADNAIHVFDVATGNEQLLIQQHADWVMNVAFNHDGTELASASRDRSARIYDAKTGELETTYLGHGAPVFGVAFTADDKFAVTCGRDAKAQVWNVNNGKKSAELSGFDGEVYQVIATREHIFSAAADKSVRQHTAGKTPALVRTLAGHHDFVFALACHEGTRRLASGSFDGEVRVWNVDDGTVIHAFTASPGFARAAADAR